MFPLGTVLFPSVFLPLHVFEPRYRVLVRRCLDGAREFGVVLIERGSDVGGGDVRSAVGTVAHIIEAAQLDDGRWALATVGTRRIRVIEWLADDPHPRAIVEDWDEDRVPDCAATNRLANEDAVAAYGRVRARLRRVLGHRRQLGDPAVDATVELTDDPRLGSFQVAAVSPLGPADQQRVLATGATMGRLALLERLLDEELDDLSRRLQLG